MSETTYRAYLSYSHEDEAWARWLHRALERYTVPRRLFAGGADRVPANLRPVFRDRDDLTTAADLTARLQGALEESEHLIVICSPAAARSRWVSEEINFFHSLGRSERIYCFVVDGDPSLPAGEGSPYPGALFESPDGIKREPLAADPRADADGKSLAFLKLAAALLGVNLDELRRRDHRRKRRLQALIALLVVAGVALAGTTLLTKQAEQQERLQAEQMASFILDLGIDLQGDIDLESLERISERALSYLERIDARRLSLDTSLKLARALQKIGEVNLYQGDLLASEASFERSLAMLDPLWASYPDEQDVLLNLVSAHFYQGLFHHEVGNYQEALSEFTKSRDLAVLGYERWPNDPVWLRERSYASSNLVNFRIDSGVPIDQTIIDGLEVNLGLAREALSASGDDPNVLIHYGNDLAYAADAQLATCRLDGALETRGEALEIAERLVAQDPGDAFLRSDVAYRYAGLAAVETSRGEIENATRHFREAIERLEREAVADPSNERIRLDIANSQRRLARLLFYEGRGDEALSFLKQAKATLAPAVDRRGDQGWEVIELLKLQLHEVEILLAEGADDVASSALGAIGSRIELIRQEQALVQKSAFAEINVLYRYASWRLSGQDPARRSMSLADSLPRSTGEFRSCGDAELLAMNALLNEDEIGLAEQIGYLSAAGYKDPGYLAFCAREDVCQP